MQCAHREIPMGAMVWSVGSARFDEASTAKLERGQVG